jgi:hypothetical protein
LVRGSGIPLHSLSQFDTEACGYSACQSLRVAFIRGPAEFEDANLRSRRRVIALKLR